MSKAGLALSPGKLTRLFLIQRFQRSTEQLLCGEGFVSVSQSNNTIMLVCWIIRFCWEGGGRMGFGLKGRLDSDYLRLLLTGCGIWDKCAAPLNLSFITCKMQK